MPCAIRKFKKKKNLKISFEFFPHNFSFYIEISTLDLDFMAFYLKILMFFSNS